MHNLHYVVTRAETGKEACSIVEEACSIVEDIAEDWGNENNWRTICGAVSQDDEVYKADDEGRWGVEETTIARINQSIQAVIDCVLDGKNTWDKDIKNTLGKLASGDYSQDRHGLRAVENWIKHLITCPKNERKELIPFDILEGHEFMSWELAEFGVTSIVYDYDPSKDETIKTWIVFVDMHS